MENLKSFTLQVPLSARGSTPTMLFDIDVNGGRWATSPSSCFADKVPKAAENFCALNLGQKVPPFTELLQDSCARVATSQGHMAPSAGISVGRN